MLIDILQKKKSYNSVFVFSNTKVGARYIYNQLKENGYSVGEATSSMTQTERDNIMKQFKMNQLKILVATDVCARGIDVASVDLVINVDIPDAVTYAHRAGRAGRFSKFGTCITLVLGMGRDIPSDILGIQTANHCMFNVLSADVMNSVGGFVPN